MSRIFITGATGYIGGDVLYALTQAFASCKITALVRSKKKASLITSRFPSVTPVIGDLDSAAQIASEVSEADVVLHLASSNHLPSATAIAQGLTETKRQSPVWIQISGASLLSGAEVATSSYGQARAQNHNDLQGISEIRNIISSSPKRAVDQMLLNLSSELPNVRTAIIYGPLIYGLGRGPVNQRSIQLPDLAKATLRLGHGVQVGKGLSCWSNIHISDLSNLVVRLVQESQDRQGRNPLLWNENGIYFAENGKMPFGEISGRIAAFAFQNGFTRSIYVQEIDAETADNLTAHGAILWGSNAQYMASRARELLNWKPAGPSIEEVIPGAVMDEALRLKSHAKI
ncbi:NAD(P)-binding protein [Aspergillus eucalypticola CBS 122712]|uniref:NAD(P)-binding protein n=1 Tax=Aspergillus eucalypticola (strain CBS 122712 / IBT 29274) TaxID=1448314 RepID=A0A317W8J0_ASPEC|nr:NAD(P)-binding protein [Aspergillus eucalypticola CBS 122712]PWY82673.1 NAD(P)-binding protein [Aspergillus eucalypticola CBS 122712]